MERGIPIAVPASERHLFEDTGNFWRNLRSWFFLAQCRNLRLSGALVWQIAGDVACVLWTELL